ncbi:MAG: metal-sensing transcriptional repressor [Stenotrophobium sp.]
MTQHIDRRHEILVRLKRIEGQLRGVQGMIERNEGCEAVAQQTAAARKALDKTFYQILSCALEQAAHETPAEISRISELLVKYG